MHADEPVVARRGTGSVFGALEPALLVLAQERLRRMAARGGAPLAGLGELEHRRLHDARVLLQVVAQPRAGRGVAPALERDPAGRDRDLVSGGVLDAIGAAGGA